MSEASKNVSQPRGRDETADKILHASMRLFGELGFKSTTTRMIAEAAHSNIGSIAYYFGNKSALYTAVIEHIAERMQEKFHLEKMEAIDDERAFHSDKEALESLRDVVRLLVQTFISGGEAERWLLLVMREQADPGENYKILYQGVFDRVYTILGKRIAFLAKKDPSELSITLECHVLIGQIVFFLVGKNPLLTRLGSITDFDESIANKIEEVVLSGLERYRK